MLSNIIGNFNNLSVSSHTISERLLTLIKNNNYIKKYKSNNKKDYHSLSYLINDKFNISHSDCIKFGFAIEKILIDIILDFNKDLINIRSKNNEKNKRETDHLFINEKLKIVYYSELKSNLNLDTEKSKSTCNKCLNIVNILQNKYPDYTIKWCLLGLLYWNKQSLNKNKKNNTVISKYKIIKNNVFSINEYFTLLNIENITFTQDTYKIFLNNIIEQMLKNNQL